MNKYSKESIIEAIITFNAEHGKPPVRKDFTSNKNYPSAATVENRFGSWSAAIEAAGLSVRKNKAKHQTLSKEIVIEDIRIFYKKHGNIPTKKDFTKNPEYVSHTSVRNIFGSWNAAIEAAGFKSNTPNLYGVATLGLDRHLYRSRSEAYFADNYLYNKYEYIIEPKYPEPYNRYYDWYIPSIDLYIELDGGIRPKVIEEKRHVNKLHNRFCLFIESSTIYGKKSLSDFIF